MFPTIGGELVMEYQRYRRAIIVIYKTLKVVRLLT
jgi:hypothetical protein